MANIRSLDGRRRWERLERRLEETTVLTHSDLRNPDTMLCGWVEGSKEGVSKSYDFVGSTDEVFGKNSVPFRIVKVTFEGGSVILDVVGKHTARKDRKWAGEYAKLVCVDRNAVELRWTSDEHKRPE